jgi:predicted ATPase/DNA-binding SARP family transcriptional activator
MSRLALHLLGTPRVLLDGAPVTVDRRKGIALLAYLAVTGRVHSRDALATLFWPEHDQITARANLRRTLSVLHTSLHDEWLAIDREKVALPQAEGLWVDVTEFRGCLDACRTDGRLDPAVCPACITELEAATSLYTDDFLAGFTLPDAPEFDDWQFRQTEILRAELSDALSRLVRCQSAQGNFAAAIGHARRRVSLDPLHEPSHCQLMEALARSGDKAGALRQYQAVTDLLRRELDAAPAPETAELARSISEDRLPQLAGQPAGVAARPAAHANGATVNGHSAHPGPEHKRHNLPAEVTSFVGREDELAELARWLAAPACRLITIVGPGGMGKTRLALQAAQAQVGTFEDGVYLVGLTAVSAKEFIAQSIAAAIGVSLQGARDPWAALLGLLSTQHVLLVLDNLEQLLPDVDFVTELLQAAPKLKIIATSRERLNLQSEWIYDLSGLRYPASVAGAAEPFGAVELFVQRVQQQRREFSVSDALSSIIEICRLVDGMPLALELAAGWTRTMGCGEIADELRRGIAILTTSHRDVPGRHRSMAAVFDHSWGLLTEAQQAAFRRLSVFRGGWTTEAAEPVAGADAAVLAALMDKSLVQRDASGRWGMHEIVRQYARQQLRAAGEEDDIRARHAVYCRELTESSEAGLLRRDSQLKWMASLETEQGNIRAALAWTFSGGDTSCGLAIAGATNWFWYFRGQLIEGQQWLQQAVARGGELIATRELVRALKALGLFTVFIGDYEEASRLFREGMATGGIVGPEARNEMSQCREYLGLTKLIQGDLAGARALLEESLAFRRQDGDRWYIAGVLCTFSQIPWVERNLDEALAMLHEALPIMREIGERHGLQSALSSMACMMLAQRQLPAALSYWQEAAGICRELHTVFGLADCGRGIAAVYALDRQPERAAVIFGAVDAVLRSASYHWPIDDDLFDGIIAEATAVLGQQEYDRLFRIGQGITLEEALDTVVGAGAPTTVPV